MFVLAIVAVIVIGIGGIGLLIVRASEFRTWCEGRGGHVHELYRGYLCLAPDGRVLER